MMLCFLLLVQLLKMLENSFNLKSMGLTIFNYNPMFSVSRTLVIRIGFLQYLRVTYVSH